MHSAVAYRELARGVGPARARELMGALHRQPPAAFLALLDDAHGDLARERRDHHRAHRGAPRHPGDPGTGKRKDYSRRTAQGTDSS